MARLPLAERIPFIERCAQDADFLMRLWAARELEALEEGAPGVAGRLRSVVMNDTAPGVVMEGIYSALRQDAPDLRDHLSKLVVHSSASVRHAARYYLTKAGHPPDYREIYRTSLHGTVRRICGAASGLGLTAGCVAPPSRPRLPAVRPPR